MILRAIGYDANNDQAKKAALAVAQNLDMLTIPVIPKTNDVMAPGKST